MAESTPSGSVSGTEPALIYDAGERRTHAEHAAEAYDSARQADALSDMAEASDHPQMRAERSRRADVCRARAQWHATMAVYESLTMPGFGMSVGDELQRRVIDGR